MAYSDSGERGVRRGGKSPGDEMMDGSVTGIAK